MGIMFKKGTTNSKRIMLGQTEIAKIMYRNNTVWLKDQEIDTLLYTIVNDQYANYNNVDGKLRLDLYRNGYNSSYSYIKFNDVVDFSRYNTITIKRNLYYSSPDASITDIKLRIMIYDNNNVVIRQSASMNITDLPRNTSRDYMQVLNVADITGQYHVGVFDYYLPPFSNYPLSLEVKYDSIVVS